jgi:hypothetical protein
MKIRSPLYINDKKETESFLLVENQHTVASAQEAILFTVKCGRLCTENSIGRVLIL